MILLHANPRIGIIIEEKRVVPKPDHDPFKSSLHAPVAKASGVRDQSE